MGIYKGAYSKEKGNENVNAGVGLDRDTYNPGRNRKVAGGKNTLPKSGPKLDIDTIEAGGEWASNSRGRGGFSGRAPRG